MMLIRLEKVRDGAEVPSYATEGSACFDLVAAEGIEIPPGATVIIPTGWKMEAPRGYEIQIRPRSGISLKTGLRVANSPGTIDWDFREEVRVILWNSSDEKRIIKKGDRIAQAQLQKVEQVKFTIVNGLTPIRESTRVGGLGSTGGYQEPDK